jgi:hypothetical protein
MLGKRLSQDINLRRRQPLGYSGKHHMHNKKVQSGAGGRTRRDGARQASLGRLDHSPVHSLHRFRPQASESDRLLDSRINN